MQKTVGDAVEHYGGEWPDNTIGSIFYGKGGFHFVQRGLERFQTTRLVCSYEEFVAEADAWRREKEAPKDNPQFMYGLLCPKCVNEKFKEAAAEWEKLGPGAWKKKGGFEVRVTHSDTLVEPGVDDAWRELADPQSWNGEGLPPVGCDCEYYSFSSDKWHKCEVRYIGSRWAVFKPEGRGETARKLCSVKFRPLKTKEERERSDTVKSICDLWWDKCGRFDEDLAKAIYDAGYRKGVK